MRLGFAIRASRLVLALMSLVCATEVVASAAAQTLIVQGSTTVARRLLEPHKAAIEADAKQILTIIPNKSRPGLIALLEGRAHMAMISSSLQHEVEALEKSMPGLPYENLQSHVVSTTRIAVVIHPSNPVRQVSLDQTRKIVLGEIANWRLVGGKNQPIRAVFVGGGGGVTGAVETELLDNKSIGGSHVIFVRTPVQLVQIVEQEPSAVGFAQLALAKQRNLPELATGRPIEQVLSFVTLGAPTPAAKSVIDAARRAAEHM
jgi:phosphate transport system substrate-binding protein